MRTACCDVTIKKISHNVYCNEKLQNKNGGNIMGGFGNFFGGFGGQDNNSCGGGCGGGSGFGGGSSLWLILILCCCGQDCLCNILPLILILSCCCGNTGCRTC